MRLLTERAQSHFAAWAIIAAIAVMTLAIALGGCAGPRTMQGMAELQAMEDQADADGVRTPEEAEAIATKQDEVVATKTEEDSNVVGLVTTGLATLIAGFFGVRAWRGPSTKGQQ